MMYGSWDIKHDGQTFLSFLTIFWPFTQKIEILKNWKKTPGDIIILHKCTKNHDHMLYCSWDMVHNRCNCYFSFWAIFCPFTPPPSPQQSRKSLKKNEKNSWVYHYFTYVYQKLWLDDVWLLIYDEQQMEKVTYRGWCPT